MAEYRIGKDRMLEMYARLAEGKMIYKFEEAMHYKCSPRSIQRDIDDLRSFFHNQSDVSLYITGNLTIGIQKLWLKRRD